MGRNTLYLSALLASAMALAACSSGNPFSSSKPPEEPNIYPTDFKKEILSTFPTVPEHPLKVRDAFVSDPILSPTGNDQRYTVCVRANSADDTGQFTGNRDRIAYFYAGHLNQLVDATQEQCGNAVYKPFPELAKFCVGTTCK